DVILPGGMTGPEIIDAARDQHPDMKVLLMSGYTREAMLHRGEITEDIQLIQKPFSSQDLGLALREILEEG
ncbi:MAG TPA: hybrid sensor histidine kinase/response regulator, partial [Gammaproteobacteria bacterium]|nr:hybrid sensor histidine kinase/response regulator [Gammaproteobacteria bacterium]